MNVSNPEVGRVVPNLAALGLGSIASRGLTFIATILLAQRLGASVYGTLIYATTFVSYFQLLAEFGLGVYGTSELARDRTQAQQWVPLILGGRIVSTILSMMALAIYLALVPQEPTIFWLTLILGFGVPISSLSLEWVFQAQEKMHIVSLARIGQALTYTVLVAVFVTKPGDVVSASIITTASLGVASASLGWVFARHYGLPSLKLNVPALWEVIKRALPIGLAAWMIQIYYNVDRLILWQYRTPAEVGWYDAAYRIVLLFVIIAVMVAQSLLPGLAALSSASDLVRLRGSMKLVAKIMIFVGMPVAVIGAALAEPIVVTLYGPTYAPSATALRIIIWQVLTVYTNVVFAQALLAFDHRRLYFFSALLGAVLNVIFNFVLDPQYGMVGAGIATMIAEVAVVSSLIFFAYKEIVIVPILPALIKAAIACGVMFAVVSFLPNFWLKLGAGGLAYGLALLALRPFDAEERRRLISQTIL